MCDFGVRTLRGKVEGGDTEGAYKLVLVAQWKRRACQWAPYKLLRL
jgi:hypothetical protein